MCRFQAFTFFLLLQLKLPKAEGKCIFLEVQQRCTCSLLNQSELNNIAVCLLAAEYELKGGNLEQFSGFSEMKPNSNVINILQALQVRKLILTDLFVPEVLLPGALEFISYTSLVSELEFVNCTFLRLVHWQYIRPLNLKVTSLRFHKVIAAPLDERFDITSLKRWLETLENLTLTESQITSIPCKIGRIFRALRFLDISGNHFQDQSINSTFCKGAFPQLQVLKLNHNNLTSYETLCKTLSNFDMLTLLDLSQNDFLPGAFPFHCMWPQSLQIFNLSNTGLEHVDRLLPPNIKVLDLKLYLSNNRLQTFPSVHQLPNLEVLNLDGNCMSRLRSKDLLYLKHLQSLKAGHNLYNCSCTYYIREIQDLAAKESLLLDWPQNYVCDSPPIYQGYLVRDVPLSLLQCNKTLISQGSVVSLLMCLSLVLHLLLA
ncbi:monocyte differentiation antigen CD14 [Protobothrops mucrosquamatus]|uniref:monocyte differentiation antigen CD14 n=1 Tax=Protobothrops mucrosquamatus TaxID=103944 RepID=UPI0007757822|nr:monocyte differentiation antigen CD14 [Protobothrops mucrosquamatus]